MNFPGFNYMIMSCLCVQADEPCIWQKLAENAITGFFTMAGIAFAAWLAYRYAVRQKKKEIFISLGQIKYERKLKALEECWKLLAFTTDTENPQVILTWVQEKGRSNKTWFFHPERAKAFIEKLAAFHYTSGLGIYMPTTIKGLLFECRGIVYGILLREKNNPATEIEVKNVEMVNRMIQIHRQLITELKNETEVIDKTGLKK